MNKLENGGGGTVYELTQDRAMEWLRRPCWSIGEVHLLLYGFDPVSKYADDFFPSFFRSGADNALVMLKRAVTAGQLKPVGNSENGEPVYSPTDVISVAKSIEFGAWKDWEEWENLSQRKPNTITSAKVSAVRGIPKQEVMNAFDGIHFDRDKWGKYLGDTPVWLKECRVMLGNKETSALWDPVQIAIALYDKEIPIKRLDAVFFVLKDWADEWKDKSDLLRS